MTDTFQQMATRIDRQSAVPLYSQIASLLKQSIAEQNIQSGQPIPPQADLASLWGVSSITVRRVIRDLADEGYLDIQQGRGTFVAESPPEHAPEPAPPSPPRRPRNGAPRVASIISNLRLSYPFFSRVLDGVRTELGKGSLLHLIELPETAPPGHTPADDIDLGGLDGLLLFSPVDLGLVLRCQRENRPYVLVHNDLADGRSHCVTVDFAAGILQAVTHLAETGRRRIALVTAGAERYSAGRAAEAWRMATAHAGRQHDERLLVHASYSEEAGHAATMQLLAARPAPDAVIYASDHSAKGGLQAASEKGLAVPADLAVVGMGDMLRPREATPTLTTIDTRSEDLGRLAAATLRRLVGGESDVPIHQSVAPRLAVRESA